MRNFSRRGYLTLNTVPLSSKHTSVFMLKDSSPELFAVVAFDEHIERVTSALYLEEPSLRLALSRKIPAKEIERKIQTARQNPL